MWFYVLLFSSLVFSENSVDLRTLKDKTFTRDNTYCSFGKQRLQIQVRGVTSHTEPVEGKYGDYFFFYPEEGKPELLPLNASHLNKYRLFEGKAKGSLCSKSFGFMLGKNKLAVLFLEENRPFMDKLTLQFFDTQTKRPLEVVETNYISDDAEGIKYGFVFKTYIEKADTGNGKIKIQGIDHAFNDMDFPYWVKYSDLKVEASGEVSFEKFPWKGHFKDIQDFYLTSGWDPKNKKFKNTFLYYAFAHSTKKECILLRDQKTNLTGEEKDWRCR